MPLSARSRHLRFTCRRACRGTCALPSCASSCPCVYLLPPLGGYTFSVRNGAAQLCLRRSRFVRDQHLWPARQRRRRLAQPYRTAVPVAIAMASCHASCTRRPRAHLLTLERGLVRLPKSHTACAVQPHRPVSRAASRDRELSHLQSPPTTTTGGGGSDR